MKRGSNCNKNENNVIEESLIESYSSFGLATGASVYDGPDMLRIITNYPFPLFNVVLRARMEQNEVRKKLQVTLDYFRSRNLPMIWWHGPSSIPENIHSLMVKQGLSYDSSPGMVIDLNAMEKNEHVSIRNFTFKRVEHLEDLKIYHSIWVKANDLPQAAADARQSIYSIIGCGFYRPWLHYLGFFEGIPVATLFLFR
jgi:hypothetical protein